LELACVVAVALVVVGAGAAEAAAAGPALNIAPATTAIPVIATMLSALFIDSPLLSGLLPMR
jgi:hypothetical protein